MRQIYLNIKYHFKYYVPAYKVEFVYFFIVLPMIPVIRSFLLGEFVKTVKLMGKEISYFSFLILSFIISYSFIGAFFQMTFTRISKNKLFDESLIVSPISNIFITILRRLMRFYIIIPIAIILLDFSIIDLLLLFFVIFIAIFYAIPVIFLMYAAKLRFKKESQIIEDLYMRILDIVLPTSFSFLYFLPRNVWFLLSLFPPVQILEFSRLLFIFKEYALFFKAFVLTSFINAIYILVSKKIFEREFYLARKFGWIKLE